MVVHSGTSDDWFGWRLQFCGNAPSEQPTERSQLAYQSARSLERSQVANLVQGEWLRRGQNLLMTGS